ncbi:hypothetical protein [Corynebacterium testudinoris]|uniref:DUF732 domain-containing protein n=1 Tax=Corynebacterium testudinoris TaxID=136857 RepID=A0A0G3H918_9CORY|nr:hypothetical protein [Corynebacterium testudinoris]AKK09881.1 hypothetical protein CTEST_12375 [Corynebacterium testudinoris]
MSARVRTRFGLAITALATAGVLAACGGATVDEDSTTATSVAPLERAPQSTTASESSSATARPTPTEAQPQDQGAREVEEVPEQSVPRTKEDLDYLEDLGGSGIDVKGVESQMIGTAVTVCRPEDSGIDAVTVPAVAGQLVEQGRSDKSPEEIATLIENAARKAYC